MNKFLTMDSFARARFLFRVCAFLSLVSTFLFGSGCKVANLALAIHESSSSPRKRTLFAMCVSPVPVWINCVDQDGKLHLTFRMPPTRASTDSDGDMQLPCGKCIGCRHDSALRWVVRMQCELMVNPNSSFITLTYNPDFLPHDNMPVKSHLQKFLKRLRQAGRDYGANVDGLKYFIVSEHGKQGTFRVHYHALIFGVDFFDHPWNSFLHHVTDDGYPLYTSKLLEKIWSYGFVSTDRATPSNASYIGKYLTKSRDTGDIRLYSQRLGVRLFCTVDDKSIPIGFNSVGLQSFRNGFLLLPSRYNSFKVSTPKFLNRYAERLIPDLFLSLRDKRRSYALSLTRDDSQLADYCAYLELNANKTKERRLHRG